MSTNAKEHLNALDYEYRDIDRLKGSHKYHEVIDQELKRLKS
jgi:hypothetical protein